MFLFFDTETTGLPRSWNAPVTDLSNWPRMVQLAWLMYDSSGEEIARGNDIIRPDGFRIPKSAGMVHGITTEKAMEEGIPLAEALGKFADMLEEAEYLIAHNISFDEKIIGAEFLRAEMTSGLFEIRQICTMKSSINFCQLPGKFGGYKNPSLTQLHTRLFGKGFDDAHDALADVIACADCFFELRNQGIIAV